jgi:hypothetical protein
LELDGDAEFDSSALSLHGLRSMGETLSRKSQGYSEYSPFEVAAAMFVNGFGLADDELDDERVDGWGVFESEKSAPIENTTRMKRKTTMIGCLPAQSKSGPQLYPNRLMTFGVADFAVAAGVANLLHRGQYPLA